MSRICRVAILLICCSVFIYSATAFAENVILPNQEKLISSLATPPSTWQNEYGKLLNISIKKDFIQLEFIANDQKHSIAVHKSLTPDQDTVCVKQNPHSELIFCTENETPLLDEYVKWVGSSNDFKKWDKIWKDISVNKKSNNEKTAKVISKVNRAINESNLPTQTTDSFESKNNFYFNEIHYFLLIPVIFGFVFILLSLQQMDREKKFCTSRCSLAIAITTAILFLAKWFLIPLENLVLTDEWENLGVIRELFKTGTFLYREVDVKGLPITYQTLDYGPMFHVYSWLFTLAGHSVMKSAAIVNCTMTTLLFPLFFILQRVLHPKHSEKFAFIMALLFATLPTNITLTKTASTNSTQLVGLLLITIFVVSATKMQKLTYTNMFAICFTAILTIYSRAEASVLMGGILGFYLLIKLKDKGSINKTLRQIGHLKLFIFSIVLIFFIAPTIFYYKIIFVDFHRSMDLNYLWQAVILLVNFTINILSPFLLVNSIPIYLTISVIAALLLYSKTNKISRKTALLPAFIFFWICLVYAFSSITMFNATFFGKTYHLGPLYLLLFTLALGTFPIVKTYPLKKQYLIVTLCILMNILGTFGQLYTDYYPNSKFTDGEILKSAAKEIEKDAVILTTSKFATMVRFTADRDNADLTSKLIFYLHDRPVYYFDLISDDDSIFKNFMELHKATLEETKFERLYKVHFPTID